ncbi:MAG: dephospho-CoA kinase [Bdellovibrionales bacterium]|nr:dephospho-CoA kinase [Bdellovibrionales bacterium]
MLWIGLTGGIATGKSTVGQLLQEAGIPVIQADQIAHLALDPKTSTYQMILQTFGPGILSSDGRTIDRQALGEIVFKNPKQREVLEGIIHPFVKRHVADLRVQMKQAGTEIAVYEIPLLFEKKLEKEFDRIVVVYASDLVQIQRLMKRNSLSEKQAHARLQSQIPIDTKRSRADDVINNETTLENLKVSVQQWVTSIKEKYNLRLL